ncbi:Predicted metal-dependent enzyme of the double-stranded beta helix superfamily [Actinomadura meyerae]|uniref:Predicted metal-dependent enzyme of the double-stranded beta helix superfamily n=1 Tax=Actinomadura meyerae TaxID=240840 RepID=A0A239N0C1_9ACTN|nr:cysteine dioxygenase family protein [Actinomadura meyerae]SNT48477.1 Predicted metal-dependent enzyme of the double-stranded beta helix superfamily [Actinomadura meyerae]
MTTTTSALVTGAHVTGPLAETAAELARSSADWLARVRFDPEGRWYERLHRDDDREIWLISWLPGQGTGLHDHGGSRGAFAVALGALEERDPGAVRTVAPGEVRAFGADYVHEVRNASAAPAISVHAYSPPLSAMNRYDLVGGRPVLRDTEEAGRW